MWLIHSAKGSTWKHPLYVKREGTPGKMEENGKYYYPDDYKGGRHLPKNGQTDGRKKQNAGEHKYDYSDNMEEWEKKVHDHVDGIINAHPDLFKTGTDVARGIMDPNNFQAVKNTLKAFGVPVDKMSDDEIKKLRRQIADAYDDKYQPTETGSSKKKKSEKKASGGEDTSKDTDKKSDRKPFKRHGRKAVDSKVYNSGMKWNEEEKVSHSGFYIKHSAKGTTWKKHKYFKKVGNRYYYSEDIKAGREKMKAADKYNATVRDNNLRYKTGVDALHNTVNDQPGWDTYDKRLHSMWQRRKDSNAAAKSEYEKSVKEANDYKNYENSLRKQPLNKITLSALNASAAMKSKIDKGVSFVKKLLSKKK